MNIRILGGAHEIGGNCIELETKGQRLLLDLGRPLSAGPDDDVPLPRVNGLGTGDDTSLLGIVVSHGHLDHYGLLERAHPNVPVFMGEAAARILAEAAFFLRNPVVPKPTAFLRDGQDLDIGPFRVRPHLVDHSAFDAYALEVEADGQKVFYTGDLRGHGRRRPCSRGCSTTLPGRWTSCCARRRTCARTTRPPARSGPKRTWRTGSSRRSKPRRGSRSWRSRSRTSIVW